MKYKLLAVAALFASVAAHAADFVLTSPELNANQPIKAEQFGKDFGCTGAGISPALEWKNAPAGTKSFAVTYYDKDAPTGSGFWHWVVYNIPADVTRLEAGKLPAGAVVGNNDAGTAAYVGSCPPVGRKHQYVYTVHALKAEKLDLPVAATAPYAGFVIYGNTIATTTLAVTAGPRK